MTRGPSEAELIALTAWWLNKRSITKAARFLGRSRQTLVNQLYAFRRLEGATDNVELALKYLDEIEAHREAVLERAA